MYKDSLAHWYDMSTPVGLPDLGKPGGNPGVGANIVSNPPGMPGGRCAEFNGTTSNYNLGDIVQLNAVSAFTIACWVNQRVIDAFDRFFIKFDDGNNNIQLYTSVGGDMRVFVESGGDGYGAFDYSAVISAGQWHHFAMVFDGSQVGNANRLIVYVDANPMTLAFTGTIPAVSPDLAAVLYIGDTASALDGRIDSFGIFTTPLTNLQVTDHKLATEQGRL